MYPQFPWMPGTPMVREAAQVVSASVARRYAPGHTTRAGLGSPHQSKKVERMRELAAKPGMPCPRCGLGMYATFAEAVSAGLAYRTVRTRSGQLRRVVLWRLDLDDFPGRRFGGVQVKVLSHRFCNRSSGARAGNAARRSAQPKARYTRW